MAATEFNSVLAGSGAVDRSGLLQALEGRGAYVVQPDEDPASLLPGHATNLLHRGVLFWFDPLDTTTAHDEVTCIVTADGKRFKADQFAGRSIRFIPVLDKDLDTAPGSPTVGDSYIVAAGGTGDWAGKDKQIASWTARGWVFIAPSVYDAAYVIDEGVFYHYSAGAVWTSGLPAITIGADTILTSALKYAKFGQAVVNQTTNDPPVSPSDGDAYVIGPIPTGAWAGNAAAIARYEGSAWVIYAPETGWRVYDASLGVIVVWNGSAWVLAGSGYIARTEQYDDSGISPSDVGSSSYTFSHTSAPVTTTRHKPDALQIVHQARRAGAVLEFHYRASISISSPDATQTWTLALFVDAGTTAEDWILTPFNTTTIGQLQGVLRYVAPDVASHTYILRVFRSATTAWNNWSRRWFRCLEVA